MSQTMTPIEQATFTTVMNADIQAGNARAIRDAAARIQEALDCLECRVVVPEPELRLGDWYQAFFSLIEGLENLKKVAEKLAEDA